MLSDDFKVFDKQHKKTRVRNQVVDFLTCLCKAVENKPPGQKRPCILSDSTSFPYYFSRTTNELKKQIHDNTHRPTGEVIQHGDQKDNSPPDINQDDPITLTYRNVIVSKNGLYPFSDFKDSLNALFGTTHTIIWYDQLSLASINQMSDIDIQNLMMSNIQTLSFAEDDTGAKTIGGASYYKPYQQPKKLFVQANEIRQSDSYALGRITNHGELGSGPWTVETPNSGSGITCFVIDSGFNTSHPEIAGKATRGKSFISGESWYSDPLGHGTSVASLICGVESGIARDVQIVPYKVFGSNASTTNTIILSAINEILATEKPLGGKVVNCSFGGSYEYSINIAVGALRNAGAVVVVAAGNDSADASNFSPASSTAVVTVGATTTSSNAANFSNYGPAVDIWCPGQTVQAAVGNTSIGAINGTSFSAPLVSGCACILLKIRGDLLPSQVKTALLNSADVTLISGEHNNYLSYIGPNTESLAFGENPMIAYDPPLDDEPTPTPDPVDEPDVVSPMDPIIDIPEGGEDGVSGNDVGIIIGAVVAILVITGFVLFRVFNPREKRVV